MGRKQIGAMLLAAALALGTTGCGSMAADGGSALAGGSARDEAMERTRGEGEAAGESSGAGITEQIQAVGGAAREASGIGIAEQPQAGDEADGEAGGAGRESTGNRNASAKEGFRAAEGYEQLLVLLRERAGNGYIEGNLYFAMDSMNSLMQAEGSSLDSNFSDPAGSAAASGSVEDSSMSGPDYSDTNVQVEGIAEADIVKTDGKYLYILSGEADGTARVSIVNVQDGAMELAASFVPEEEEGEYYNGEMYISGDTLVLVRECRKTVRRIKEQDGDMLWENRIYLWNGWRTN
ncbi:MAG: beta-propeller domain-containing protein [Lachnospiraceae bacterium]|nr:beta-propeller domain-containing protein [Lachnospiraceae bacterium]